MAQYKLSGNATKIYNVFTSHLQIILELRSLASTIVSVSRKKKKFSSTKIKDTILLV